MKLKLFVFLLNSNVLKKSNKKKKKRHIPVSAMFLPFFTDMTHFYYSPPPLSLAMLCFFFLKLYPYITFTFYQNTHTLSHTISKLLITKSE